MLKLVIAAALVLTSLLVASSGKAEIPDGFADVHYLVAKVPGLVPIQSDIPTLSSPSAQGRAVTYASIISRASRYFERELGWTLPVRLMVLNKDDWNKIADIPYPAPHIWTAEKLILMPDSLAEFPGFDDWGFDDMALNAVLTVHELGHGLAHVNGLEMRETDLSITEIIANVFMASFIINEMPEMTRLLEGAPNGFSPTEAYQLSDFDYFYVALGLQNYAYFQFAFAKTAAFMVRNKPLSKLMPEMVKVLPRGANFLSGANLERLDELVLGAAATLKGLDGEPRVPDTTISSCRNVVPENHNLTDAVLLIENRGTSSAKFRDLAYERRLEDFALGIAELRGEEPEKVEPQYIVVPPERWLALPVVSGQEVIVVDEGCIQVDASPARFVVRK